jgi:hypothetical protein
MKRKIVLRLLAAVMAATLVVTGVPSTALTGIETVYASGEEGGEATSIAEYTVSVTGVDSLT